MTTDFPSISPQPLSVSSREGVVRWFSPARGYGFLRAADGEEAGRDLDIFVHHSALSDEALAEGDRVTFTLIDGPRGLQARHVVRVAPR